MCVCACQLENRLGGDEEYQQRVTKHLIPCVGQFAVSLADDTQWKSLNYNILLKSRHADAKVTHFSWRRFARLEMGKLTPPPFSGALLLAAHADGAGGQAEGELHGAASGDHPLPG